MPIKISSIKANKDNPRIIKDGKFEDLKRSIDSFPKMMELRPIIINADDIILGGNMRFAALKDLGYKELPDNWVKRAEDLTEDEQRQFIIKDNVSGGDWDWDILANEWDAGQLVDWGMDVPNYDNDNDYSDKNKEIDIEEYEDKMIIKLQYVENEYHLVKDSLLKLASTPEQAIFKLLGLDNE